MSEDKQEAPTPQEPEVKMIPQEQVDRIIQERLAREKNKYSDYEDLLKFKTEHQKQLEEQSQKELESQKEYEKLKESWQTKEQEYQSKLTQAQQQFNQEKISNALTMEVMRQSAYPDAVNLIKENAVVDDSGNIGIKSKDANGFDITLSIEEGVKQFLHNKPYLVKSEARQGAGTGSASTPGQQQGQPSLVEQLQLAQASGDRKKAQEIKNAIRAKHMSQGITGGVAT